MASVFDAFTGRVNTAEGGQVFNFTTSARVWLGEGDFIGFRLNAQTAVGSGIKVYDGWNANPTRLIWAEGAPTVSQTSWYGPTTPHRFKDGLYIEFLGTGQNVDVMVAE